MSPQRRQFLRVCTIVGAGIIAGCSGGSEDSPESTPTGSATATNTPGSTPEASGDGTQQAKLFAADGDGNDDFGESVAVSNDGTTALVGASNDEDPNGQNSGSVYAFSADGDTWSQQQKLVLDDGTRGDAFGKSLTVSRDGTTALIGAYKKDSGTAYVYTNAGGSWEQQARLTAADGDPYDNLGWSVALTDDGTTALIGDYGNEAPNGREAGAAYVFSAAGESWTQEAKLAAADGDSIDFFGRSVGISDDATTGLVGAANDEDPNGGGKRRFSGAGSAYVFERSGDTWGQQAKLAPDDGDDNDLFGESLALSSDGTTAVIGAPGDETPNASGIGSAYVFTKPGDSWEQAAKLTATNSQSGSLGNAVALSDDGTTALVGARTEAMPHGDRAGAAYVFEQSGGSWSQQRKLVASDGDPDDHFGRSVALSDDAGTAVVGANGDEDPNGAGEYAGSGAGSAYVFEL